MPEDWISTNCALCGTGEDEVIFTVPHEAAPDGKAFLVRCRCCGLRRLNPRPGPAIIGRYYATAGGENYNAYAGRRRTGNKQRLWEFIRDGATHPPKRGRRGRLFAPVTGMLARWLFDINVDLAGRSDQRVLEVGCGYGDLLIYLRSRGARVIGTDLSPSAIEKGATYGLELRLGHFRELAFPAGSFDTAIACHSLEHVPDPNVELAEFARVLRPGGQLHLAVPNGESGALRLHGARWAHLSFPLHFWLFDPDTLTQLLYRHGFMISRGPKTAALHHLHHALNTWRSRWGTVGIGPATRELRAWLRACSGRNTGEFLRLVATKRPD